jgi:adenylate cyclase
MLTGKSLKFEAFTLDLERFCLHGPSGRNDLRRKTFDVLRFLIEQAGRVVTREELAKAVWPGVVVSEESLTHCISEIRRAIADQEQRIIRTVPRRGYLMDVPISSVDGLATRATGPTETPKPCDGFPTATPLPDRPSIAVLAFTNLSGDPQQEYFSDGITEDIITELSRSAELSVIARNSAFQYKGRSVDLRQVGQQLGVRYVLEGSIQRAGDRIRITAQLVDSTTGRHRWADRYDRKIEDVFLVQDEVTRTIAAILTAHVNKAEVERTLIKPPTTWRAYDYHMRATDALVSFWPSFDVERLYETRRLLERSLVLDPSYARAYGTLSHTYAIAWTNPLDDDFLNPDALDRAYALALKGVQIEPNLPLAHAHLGSALTWKRQLDAALAEFEKAIALNPNFTDWRLAAAMIFAGEPQAAIGVVQALMRLDPYYHPLASGWLGLASYQLKCYSQALTPLRECLSRMPNYRSARAWLAATYAQLGLQREARAEVAEILRIDAKHTIDGYYRRVPTYKFTSDAEHLFDGLRKAGLPEK